MVKAHSKFVCQQCGYSQVGWAGKCPNCGSWGSLVETTEEVKKSKSQKLQISKQSKITKLSNIKANATTRISTKISELDRVLGGGIVPGQVVLIAGDPGIGKSTILLQLADKLPNSLYATAEESAGQIKIRANRLKIKGNTLSLLEETDIDGIINSANNHNKLSLLIIDSIQTVRTSDLSGMPGSIGQVRESASRLVNFAKSTGVPVFLVGHVTKEGSVAGPSTLAHLVDTVLWFEGDKSLTLRLIRSIKNRFGSTDEVGVFAMEDSGLTPVRDIQKLFLSDSKQSTPGSCIAVMMQGSRPVLVEIQSLVVRSKLAFPRRIAQAVDSKRLELILAILAKRAGISLMDWDVFVNVVGGITIRETGADLAIALSIASAFFDKSIAGYVAVGELGLLGEIRAVVAQARRIKEARALGYSKIISNSTSVNISKVIHNIR